MPDPLCPSEDDLLALAVGEPSSAELSEHLDTCRSCATHLERLRAELADLRRTLAAPTALDATDSFAVDRQPQTRTEGPIPLPATIGRYRVLSRLAIEGEAEVYRVMHPTIANELVLKLTHRPPAGATPEHDRRLAEARVLADLVHPNLVRVHDLDFHDGRPFLVMEYVRGPNLKQYAEAHRPAPREAAALVAKAARAVAAAHARGVVHCDLKPKNILIDETGQPRVIDFGLALRRGAWVEETERGLSGTPAFMAPEQARGDAEKIGPASDIFALGGVLYYLLTGKPPFAGKDVRETLDRAARCDFDRAALRAPGIPRRLAAVCLRALAADPAQRYARADHLAEDLERAAHGPEILSVAIAVAVVLLLSAGAAGVWWWLRPPPAATPGPQYLLQVNDHEPGRLLQQLPLRNGDRVRIRCDLPRGFQAAAFALDSAGVLTELTPAETTRAGPFEQLLYPGDGQVVPVQGPPGTELLLVCAGRSSRPSRADVEQMLAPLRPLPPLPADVLVRLGLESVEVEKKTNRDFGAPESSAVAEVRDRLDTVRRALRERCEFVAGVAVPHQR